MPFCTCDKSGRKRCHNPSVVSDGPRAATRRRPKMVVLRHQTDKVSVPLKACAFPRGSIGPQQPSLLSLDYLTENAPMTIQARLVLAIFRPSLPGKKHVCCPKVPPATLRTSHPSPIPSQWECGACAARSARTEILCVFRGFPPQLISMPFSLPCFVTNLSQVLIIAFFYVSL